MNFGERDGSKGKPDGERGCAQVTTRTRRSEVFAQNGFDRATISEITREAEHGKGTFYVYYPSKVAIAVALRSGLMATMATAAEKPSLPPQPCNPEISTISNPTSAPSPNIARTTSSRPLDRPRHGRSTDECQNRWQPPPALALTDLWKAVDTAFASRRLRNIWVTGTLVRLTRGDNRAFGELSAFDDDGQPLCNLGVHAATLHRLEREPAVSGVELTEGVEGRASGVLEGDRRCGKLRLLVGNIDHRVAISDHATRSQALIDELRTTGLMGRQQALDLAEVPHRVGVLARIDLAP